MGNASLRRFISALAGALLVALAAAPAAAQPPRPIPSAEAPPAASAAAPPPAPEMAPDSPRASVKHYLDLCRAGEYAEAAEYLDLPEARRAEGPLLARRLKAVLDRQIWVKVEDISPAPLGKASDRLPPGVEEIGTIPGRSGPEPVRLVRRHG